VPAIAVAGITLLNGNDFFTLSFTSPYTEFDEVPFLSVAYSIAGFSGTIVGAAQSGADSVLIQGDLVGATADPILFTVPVDFQGVLTAAGGRVVAGVYGGFVGL
jgi:hypothetical protein